MASRKGVDVGVKITGSAKDFKAASEDAKRATAELKRKAVAHSRDIERNFKMMTIALAKVAAALIVVKKGFEVYDKIMISTNATGDKLAIQQSRIKFALDEIKRSIATVNFIGLGERMRDAAKAGEELAKQLDLIFDLSLRMKLIESDLNLEMIQQELIFRNSSYADGIRVKAAQRYLDIVAQLEKEQLDYAQAEIKAALAAGTVVASGLAEKRLRYYVENADLLGENEDAVKAYITAQKELQKGGIMGAAGMFIPYSTKEIAAFQKIINDASDTVKDFARDYTQWMLITDPERQGLTNAWARLGEIMKAAAEKALKPLRSVNSLLKEGTEDIIERTEAYSKATTAGITYPTLGKKPTLAGLAPTPAPVDELTKAAFAAEAFNDKLQNELSIVSALDSAFVGFFQNMGTGIDAMAKSFIGAINQIAAQLAAKAAVFGILSLLFPGSAIVKEGLGSFLKGVFNLAGGGLVTGPTLANVGEYAGAKTDPEVIAPLSKLKGLLGGQMINVKVDGKLLGRDIYIAGMRYGELIGRTT